MESDIFMIERMDTSATMVADFVPETLTLRGSRPFFFPYTCDRGRRS